MTDENPYAPPEAPVDIPAGNATAELAGRGTRLGAAIIDGLIMTVVILPVAYLIGTVSAAFNIFSGQPGLTALAFGAILGIGVYLLLNGYLLATSGQTIGKRMLNVRIVSYDTGELLPLSRIIGLRFLPFTLISQIPLVGPVINLVNVLFIFNNERRCLHDLLARSKVVKA